MSGWRHNDDERQWEYGYHDVPRDQWVSLGTVVTDELIERVADLSVAAQRLYRFCGSVPPPLAAYPPPPAPVLYADAGPGAEAEAPQ